MNIYKKYILYFFIIVISLNFLNCAKNNSQSIDLSGEWNLHKDVDSKILFTSDAEPLKKIKIPGSWPELLSPEKEMTSTVWIQKKIFIGNDFKNKLLFLSLGKIALADETYFNGVKIGGKGIIPDSKNILHYGFKWLTIRKYTIPENIINYNEENIISVRIFSHIINGIDGKIILTTKTDQTLFKFDEDSNINIYTIIINIILGTIFFIMTGINRKRKMLLYSIPILFIVVFVFILFMGIFDLNGLYRYKIILFLYNFGYFLFLMAVQEFFEIRFKSITCFSFILVAIAEILIIFSYNSSFLIYKSGLFSIIINIILLTFYSGIFALALYRSPKKYWIFILAAIPLLITSAYAYYYILSFQLFKFPETFFLHLTITLSALIIVMLLDFFKIKTEKEMLTIDLETKEKNLRKIQNSIKKDSNEPRDKISEIIKFIDENFKTPYNRNELAKKFFMNEDYMGQLFKKTTGQNISSYINLKRIEAAKELLKNSEIKIIDIAYNVGFETLVHFHRQFKKATKMTPQKYRDGLKE